MVESASFIKLDLELSKEIFQGEGSIHEFNLSVFCLPALFLPTLGANRHSFTGINSVDSDRMGQSVMRSFFLTPQSFANGCMGTFPRNKYWRLVILYFLTCKRGMFYCFATSGIYHIRGLTSKQILQ
jgi:hypothetical protein